jgi:hypothetical protein
MPAVRIELAALFLLSTAACAAPLATEWQRAADCVGEICAVSGSVASVEESAGAIRLYFDDARRDVRVNLVRGWLVSWPDYRGRAIVATGPVRRFREFVEITVHDPAAIQVAGDPPAATPAPAQEEVQELRDEIRRLQRRVDELEEK